MCSPTVIEIPRTLAIRLFLRNEATLAFSQFSTIPLVKRKKNPYHCINSTVNNSRILVNLTITFMINTKNLRLLVDKIITFMINEKNLRLLVDLTITFMINAKRAQGYW